MVGNEWYYTQCECLEDHGSAKLPHRRKDQHISSGADPIPWTGELSAFSLNC